MAFKRSSTDINKNSRLWTDNLVRFEKAIQQRKSIPCIEASLENYCKIPMKSAIIGRYHYLAKNEKCRKSRFKMIAEELEALWIRKLNFPVIKLKSIVRRVENLISEHDTFIKRPGQKDEKATFAGIFDITCTNGEWLSGEDKQLYEKQVLSGGKVGYTTTKCVPVHPSKTMKVSSQSPMSFPDSSVKPLSSSDSENNSETSDDESYEPREKKNFVSPHQSTTAAVTLVRNVNISTRKVSAVCKQLSADGISLPTPSHVGILKAMKKQAEEMKINMKRTLKEENWALHFDGKKVNGKELQVVLIKNAEKEVRLGVLTLENSRAQTIATGIKDILDYFELWAAMKMIVTDTTAVNTGRKNGVVVILQRQQKLLNLPVAQYVGCQHHVLDRILKHVMDETLGGDTSSPDIAYDFVDDIVREYDSLKTKFVQSPTRLNLPTITWRDDMLFLLELGYTFRYFLDNGEFPYIKFRGLPNLSNARWNSRGIYAILAFILLPQTRNRLRQICSFICGIWLDIWFSDHRFEENSYAKLAESVQNYEKAKKCFYTHWSKEPSIIDSQRSNICAERAILFMQSLYCKTPDSLSLRFIFSNKDL
jgi:hypothetical protein